MMAAIYLKSDAQSLLENKYLLLLGDSNTRAVYKDLVWLLQRGTLIDDSDLRRKLERSFLGDKLVGRSELHRGRNFQENRCFESNNMKIHFHFLTRCYNDVIEKCFLSFKVTQKYPDLIYLSSLLWDITRWGPNGVTEFKENMKKLMDLIKSTIPPETLVIWGTTLPISSKVKNRGFLIKQVEFMEHTLRFEVMEGNTFASQLVSSYGYDVLDLHYQMRMQIHRRCKDGIHFINTAVRHVTNLLLTHIALSWSHKLPGVYISKQIKNMLGEDPEGLTSNSVNQLYTYEDLVKLRRGPPAEFFPHQGNSPAPDEFSTHRKFPAPPEFFPYQGNYQAPDEIFTQENLPESAEFFTQENFPQSAEFFNQENFPTSAEFFPEVNIPAPAEFFPHQGNCTAPAESEFSSQENIPAPAEFFNQENFPTSAEFFNQENFPTSAEFFPEVNIPAPVEFFPHQGNCTAPAESEFSSQENIPAPAEFFPHQGNILAPVEFFPHQGNNQPPEKNFPRQENNQPTGRFFPFQGNNQPPERFFPRQGNNQPPERFFPRQGNNQPPWRFFPLQGNPINRKMKKGRRRRYKY